MVPTLIGSSVAQINLLFDTFIAALLLPSARRPGCRPTRTAWNCRWACSHRAGHGDPADAVPPPRQHRTASRDAGLGPARDADDHRAGDAGADAAVAAAGLDPVPAGGAFTAFDTRMTALSVIRAELRPAGVRAGEDRAAGVLRPPGHPDAGEGPAWPRRSANMGFNIALLTMLCLGSRRAEGRRSVPEAAGAGLHFALGIGSALASYLEPGAAVALAAQGPAF